MGNAFLIMRRSASIEYEDGLIVSIRMDLFEISDKSTNDRYRFSWIAFDSSDPDHKVLFDNHAPKGAHFHLKDREFSFAWNGVQHALKLFVEQVALEFGEHPELVELANVQEEE